MRIRYPSDLEQRLRSLDQGPNTAESYKTNESKIDQQDRIKWLLVHSKKKAALAVIHHAIVFPISFYLYVWLFRSSIERTESFYQILEGGFYAISLNPISTIFTYLYFSRKVMLLSLIGNNSALTIGAGGYGDSPLANPIEHCFVNASISSILFGIADYFCPAPQIGNVVFAFAFGFWSGSLVHSAVDRIADASNVARTGSIVRHFRTVSSYINYTRG